MMHIQHITECTVIPIGTAMLAGLGLLMSETTNKELQMLVLPFMASAIIAWVVMLLNPQIETRRVTAGRAIFALFVGALAPSFIGWLYEPATKWPLAAVFVVGGAAAGAGYILILPFTRRAFEKAKATGEALADLAEKKLIHAIGGEVSRDAKIAAKELREKPMPVIVENTPTNPVPIIQEKP